MSTETKGGLPKGSGIRLAVQVAFVPAYAGMFLLIAAAVRFFWLPQVPELSYVDALGIMAAVAAWKATRLVAAALGDGIVESREESRAGES